MSERTEELDKARDELKRSTVVLALAYMANHYYARNDWIDKAWLASPSYRDSDIGEPAKCATIIADAIFKQGWFA